jgi:hypothetical protein
MEGHPEIDLHRRMRNDFAHSIRLAKQAHWSRWLEKMDETSIWDAHQMTRSPATDGGASRVPELKVGDPITGASTRTVRSNEEKVSIFYKQFFPPKPHVSSVPADQTYPQPRWTHEGLSNDQIHAAIRKLKEKKACKPGTVTNYVFKHTAMLLVPYLGALFYATDELHWYPELWKITHTPVIKKPGKMAYSAPNAWRPIVLADGFAKLLNKCKADQLMEQCEKTGVLPANHFGGRPGRSTNDSIHMIIKMVKDTWRKGLVASVLFLNVNFVVKGAFPSVAVDMMAHEYRAAGIPEEHVNWMLRRLDGRHTIRTFDDFHLQEFSIDNGVDQGDPVSGITYMIYNAGLLRCLKAEDSEHGALYIDDVYVLTLGRSFADTHHKLRDIMERLGGILQWATEHNCEFGLDKFQLLDLSRKREAIPGFPLRTRPLERPDLQFRNTVVKSAQTARFLGVIIDHELRWKEQGASMVAKGLAWAAQIQRIARVTRGVPPFLIRWLYLAVVVPRIMYAADICLKSGRRKAGAGSAVIVARLTAIQRKAAIAITGAMKTTATDVLDAHANLLPMQLLIEKMCSQAALCLATIPKHHPLEKHIRQVAQR